MSKQHAHMREYIYMHFDQRLSKKQVMILKQHFNAELAHSAPFCIFWSLNISDLSLVYTYWIPITAKLFHNSCSPNPCLYPTKPKVSWRQICHSSPPPINLAWEGIKWPQSPQSNRFHCSWRGGTGELIPFMSVFALVPSLCTTLNPVYVAEEFVEE